MTRFAVVICCDQNYFPLSCFFANQIADFCPQRNFDILIAAADEMPLPADLGAKGAEFLLLTPGDELKNLSHGHLPPSTYYRLWLPDMLCDRYDRVLYLDADMFVEGGDLSALFTVEMWGRPVAAVRDVQQWLRPNKHLRDFRLAGKAPAPYFNGGFELFDTKKYRADNVLAAAMEYALARPEALIRQDQSLLNIILYRNWAELSPLWNWQWASKRPLFGIAEPICISHFAGSVKPWGDSRGICPPRYWAQMQLYFEAYFPDTTMRGQAVRHEHFKRRFFVKNALEHALIMPTMRRYLDRFKTPLHSIAV